ncbi:MAG: 4-phosphoerythronate dehydrogenase [Cellvibrionales bacterium]|nr:4-phosphoerythronate dehydrogenase [Cellvibrionales bacterium]
MVLTVLADENIPGLDWLDANGFSVRTKNGRTITADDLIGVEVLLVRSVTQVDEALLKTSQVVFVGSCTIGTDHVDLEWLASNNIHFANAPGCNANAVVDYVVTAMLSEFSLTELRAKTVGVLGAGQVGSRLVKRLDQLAIPSRVCDPFVAVANDSLDDVLACDVISLHVPLTRSVEYATYHLIDAVALSQLKEGAMLINTSRGQVIDEEALSYAVNRLSIKAVLDVFASEPVPDNELLSKLLIKTPHIAGYSVQGKLRGSLQVFEALFQFLGRAYDKPALLDDTHSVLTFKSLPLLLDEVFEIQKLSRDFYAAFVAASTTDEKAACFDQFRKRSASRNEWGSIQVTCQDASANLLSNLGFLCPTRN